MLFAHLVGLVLLPFLATGVGAEESNKPNEPSASECGKKSVGNNQLNWLINESDDAYFVDDTTKLYAGTVSPDQYRSDINGFYPTGANEAALDCIFAQRDGG